MAELISKDIKNKWCIVKPLSVIKDNYQINENDSYVCGSNTFVLGMQEATYDGHVVYVSEFSVARFGHSSWIITPEMVAEVFESLAKAEKRAEEYYKSGKYKEDVIVSVDSETNKELDQLFESLNKSKGG